VAAGDFHYCQVERKRYFDGPWGWIGKRVALQREETLQEEGKEGNIVAGFVRGGRPRTRGTGIRIHTEKGYCFLWASKKGREKPLRRNGQTGARVGGEPGEGVRLE